MESMKHFASTKYNVSVIIIFFFSQQIYCILYVTLEQQQNSNRVFYTFTSSYCICLCKEHLSQSVYNSVRQNIADQCFSQDKENVRHKVTAREKGLSVIVISSQHCLREASPELVKRSAVSHLSYQAVVEPLEHCWHQTGVGLTNPNPHITPWVPQNWTSKAPPLHSEEERWSRERRGLCRLLEDEHSWGREYMQGLTKWKQSVLHSLKAHGSMLQCVCVCVCTCVRKHAKTYQKEEGPLGLCPFAVILIQLYTSRSLPPHLYRFFSHPHSGG